MPVIVVPDAGPVTRFPCPLREGRGCVQDEVVWRIVEDLPEPLEDLLHNHREMLKLVLINEGKIVAVHLGSNAKLKGKTGSEGRKDHEMLIVQDNAFLLFKFLLDNITHHAAFLEQVVFPDAFQLHGHKARCDGDGDNLRVAVTEACTRLQAIVLEYESRYPEIINCYFNEKNIGNKVTQLNTYRGFQTLRGEYFALLEGDDYWTDPEKLVRQIGFLKENPDYVACAHYTMKVFDDESSPPEHFLPFKAFNSVTATMYDLVAMNGVYHLSSIIYRNVFGQTPPQCLADPYSCEVTINMVYGQYGNFYCIDEYMSAYRVHGKGEFSTRSQEDIWRFHLHGFRHFFFYLGPVYYSIFSPVVLKYSRYVLRAPRAGFVKSLKLSTRILFAVHIVFFAPFLVLNLVNKRALGKVYLFLITHLPLPIKKGLRYIVNRSPRLYKLKLTLFDHFVGDDKRGPEED